MRQQIMIVDDASERTAIIVQALRDSGYGVMTVQAHSSDELYASLCRVQPDILVIGEEVVIDLKTDYGMHMLREIGIPAY